MCIALVDEETHVTQLFSSTLAFIRGRWASLLHLFNDASSNKFIFRLYVCRRQAALLVLMGAERGRGRWRWQEKEMDVAVKYREGISFRYPTFSENGPKFVNILLGYLPEFFPPIYWQIDILLKDHVLGSCYHCLSARCRQHRREEELRICSGDGGDSYLKLGALSYFTLWVHAGLCGIEILG